MIAKMITIINNNDEMIIMIMMMTIVMMIIIMLMILIMIMIMITGSLSSKEVGTVRKKNLMKTIQHNSKSISISKTQVGLYINQYCCQIKRVTYLALGVTTASDWPVSALTSPWYSHFHSQQQRDIQTSDEFSFPTIIKLLPLPGRRVTG